MINHHYGMATSLAAFAFVLFLGIGDASAHGMGGGGGGGGGPSVPTYRPPVVQLPIDPGMLGDLNSENIGNPGPPSYSPDASPSPDPAPSAATAPPNSNVSVFYSDGMRVTTVYDHDAAGRSVKTITIRDTSTGMVLDREVVVLDSGGNEVSRTSTNYAPTKGATAAVEHSGRDGSNTLNSSTTVKDPSARNLRQQTLQQLGIGK